MSSPNSTSRLPKLKSEASPSLKIRYASTPPCGCTTKAAIRVVENDAKGGSNITAATYKRYNYFRWLKVEKVTGDEMKKLILRRLMRCCNYVNGFKSSRW
ncbi:hypothetical protein CDL12_07325 [Handroanthus impetiginosus]|uniref:Uncharacterized protein n=1 Tax=Handroanthus impetiginosus TaxID=429701 RepID=A0A2G9HRS9_9LAMI|nr:hypothetical protein CDL12_07325 [Handroanthus impetiginosus]